MIGIFSLWNTAEQVEAVVAAAKGARHSIFSLNPALTPTESRLKRQISSPILICLDHWLCVQAAYKVGAHSINAQTIEHIILGCRSIRPSQWFHSLLSQATKFKSSDERRAYGLHAPEPLVCFALCCGGRSDPAVCSQTLNPIFHSKSPPPPRHQNPKSNRRSSITFTDSRVHSQEREVTARISQAGVSASERRDPRRKQGNETLISSHLWISLIQ